MAMTVRQLVADRALGLRVAAGHDALDRPIGWVHVSELADPTPFLEGGELLLTTGLALREVAAFVDRVVARGLAGLGFGTGLGHDTVPVELIRAAGAAGLPLLEVPKRTPFIAISKAVAADVHAETTATDTAQRELTSAALRGPDQVARRLAKLIGGWVLVLNPAGAVVTATPAGVAARKRPAELDRLRGRVASATYTVDGESIAVQALGRRGFLVVGRPLPFDRVARRVLTAGASVLTLALAHVGDVDQARRRLRAAVLRLLLAEQPELAVDVWPLPAEPVELYAFSGPAGRRAQAMELLESRDVFCAELDGLLIAVNVGGPLDGLRGGVSEPVEYARAAHGHRQARRAAELAPPGELARYGDHAGTDLLRLLDPADARTYVDSLLGPVLRHDTTGRGDLIGSLTEWLRRNGQWDPAATRLGIHRHTLRNRIDKVAELIARDLDSPGVRAELWLALRLLDDR
jgi:PucR family transcriptional regulator, purine catabolism regulatory protein